MHSLRRHEHIQSPPTGQRLCFILYMSLLHILRISNEHCISLFVFRKFKLHMHKIIPRGVLPGILHSRNCWNWTNTLLFLPGPQVHVSRTCSVSCHRCRNRYQAEHLWLPLAVYIRAMLKANVGSIGEPGTRYIPIWNICGLDRSI